MHRRAASDAAETRRDESQLSGPVATTGNRLKQYRIDCRWPGYHLAAQDDAGFDVPSLQLRDGLKLDSIRLLRSTMRKTEPKCSERVDIGSEPAYPSEEAPQDYPQLIDQLREAVQNRDRLLATIAHELRNPLTPIQLCIELIRRSHERGDQPQMLVELDRLERSIHRFLRRTAVLLRVAEANAGTVWLEPVETDLSAVITETVHSLMPLVNLSRSPLSVELEPEIHGWLDPVAVSQVIENLLSNAIKYGGGQRIQVGLKRQENKAQLTVQDNGAGISAEDQARIFKPFQRVGDNHGQPGLGLGLWITRQLIEAMNGTISLDSKEGAGSRFVVTFPLRRA
jgi:two-component system OmpR family sensor kinase